MPKRQDVAVRLEGLSAIDGRDGSRYDLGALDGVHVVVLIRHRH